MKILKLIQAYLTLWFTGWHTLYFVPPDTRLLVKDNDFHYAFAHPTYYPFEIKTLPGDELKPWGWRGTVFHYEDGASRWDGGWMIDVSDCKLKEFGKIKYWKLIQ